MYHASTSLEFLEPCATRTLSWINSLVPPCGRVKVRVEVAEAGGSNDESLVVYVNARAENCAPQDTIHERSGGQPRGLKNCVPTTIGSEKSNRQSGLRNRGRSRGEIKSISIRHRDLFVGPHGNCHTRSTEPACGTSSRRGRGRRQRPDSLGMPPRQTDRNGDARFTAQFDCFFAIPNV